MISSELLNTEARKELTSEKWLFNIKFKQAKWFNKLGHQFFKDGKYKQWEECTQLQVSERLLFIIEKLEEEHISLQKAHKETISRLEDAEWQLDNPEL